ncbi:MAG: hypothetical protein PVF58_08370 [Candidatus Methanofastidiosia archaeon]
MWGVLQKKLSTNGSTESFREWNALIYGYNRSIDSSKLHQVEEGLYG